MINKKTEPAFWDSYWEHIRLPSVIDKEFSFDRCLSKALGYEIEKGNLYGRVLEIGAAPGKYLTFFHENKFDISGLEYSEVGIEALKLNFAKLGISEYELIEGDLFKTKATEKFDIVMSFGFIEHFDDVDAVIQHHLAWLKPGGTLILGVPVFKNLHGWLQKLLDKRVIDLHNIDIMNLEFFRDLPSRHSVHKVSSNYICSFEPSLPIHNRKLSFKYFIPILFIRILLLLRKFKFFDNFNSKYVSSYIFTSAVKI